MCGVVGIVRKDGNVAPDLYVGVIKLQHRAHDMAGIATSDGEMTYLSRGMGEVAVAFSKSKLGRMKGRAGIGHVRWTTVGDVNIQNAHPIAGLFRTRQNPKGKRFYIGHNGQIAQDELKVMFPRYKPDVTTDTKFIAALISSSGKETFEDALQYACSILKGAYSLVILYDDAVYGVRDTSGNRPLVLGANGGALMVASEAVAFNPLGGHYVDEVHPGEMVKISRESSLGFQRISIKSVPDEMPRQLTFCLFEMIYLLHPASIFLGRTVQMVRERMGVQLFKEHPLDADVVIGVPDSGLAAARGYARASGIPKESGIIRSHYSGRVFINAVAERDEKHRIKHDVIRQVIEGKRVVVLDDSIVEGRTSIKIVKLLRENGAREVYLLSSSPPPMTPCYYGVPTALSQRRLIAADHKGNVEAIRKEIGADYLGYLSIQGTIRAVVDTASCIAGYPEISEKDFCTACFSGNYLIPH